MEQTDQAAGHTLISLDKASASEKRTQCSPNEPRFAISLSLAYYYTHTIWRLFRWVIDTRGVDLGNKKEKQKLFACKQKQQRQQLNFSGI